MVTYADLATEAVRIDLAPTTYRHEDQMSSLVSEAGAIYMNTTFNGTRTFDFSGNPNDSDND
jgi:hypothetical protein